MEQRNDRLSVVQVSAGHFANDEWVHAHLFRIKQGGKVLARPAAWPVFEQKPVAMAKVDSRLPPGYSIRLLKSRPRSM